MLLREMENFKTSLSSGNRYLPFKHWHASCSIPHAPYPPPRHLPNLKPGERWREENRRGPRGHTVTQWSCQVDVGGGGQYSYISVLHYQFPRKSIVFTVCEHEYMNMPPPPIIASGYTPLPLPMNPKI